MVAAFEMHVNGETDPARDTISVTPFMTTSENGFAVTEDKQEQGEYILGAVATEDEGKTDGDLSADDDR